MSKDLAKVSLLNLLHTHTHTNTQAHTHNDWRASEANETLSGVYKFELVRYMYVYIYVWRYVYHHSSACHAYIMLAELGHSHPFFIRASHF